MREQLWLLDELHDAFGRQSAEHIESDHRKLNLPEQERQPCHVERAGEAARLALVLSRGLSQLYELSAKFEQ